MKCSFCNLKQTNKQTPQLILLKQNDKKDQSSFQSSKE